MTRASRVAEQLLTAFISHYEHSCGRTRSFGIKHLQWHQVLSVRLQIMDLMTLQEEEENEIENKFLIQIKQKNRIESSQLEIKDQRNDYDNDNDDAERTQSGK